MSEYLLSTQSSASALCKNQVHSEETRAIHGETAAFEEKVIEIYHGGIVRTFSIDIGSEELANELDSEVAKLHDAAKTLTGLLRSHDQ